MSEAEGLQQPSTASADAVFRQIQRERLAWRESLLNGLFWAVSVAAIVVSLFAVGTGLLRWATWPFVAVTIVLLIVTLLPALGFRVRAGILITGLYVATTLPMMSMGLAPNALVGYAALAAVCTMLMGLRWGVAALAINTLTLVAVFASTCFGLLIRQSNWPVLFDTALPSVAVRIVVIFMAATGIVVFGIAHLLGHAERLLAKNATALDDLQQEVAEGQRLRDALDRHRAAFAREEQLKIMGRLAGYAAHDFNNALLVIQTSTDLIRQLPSDVAHVMEFAELIDKASIQAAATAKQLRAFGGQGGQPIAPLDAEAQLATIVRMLRQLLPRNVSVQFEARVRAMIRTDEATLQTSMVNLALNARDAMLEGGEIRIVLREAMAADVSTDLDLSNYVVVDVTDTGVGIEATDLQRIFEPFFTTKGPGGSGLGLSSVHDAIVQLGGQIRVASVVGKGTTFSMLWPRAGSAISRNLLPVVRDGSGFTVLLVEADGAVRKTLAKALSCVGYVVLQASSGEESLLVARRHRGSLDAVVMDPATPGPPMKQVIESLLNEFSSAKIVLSPASSTHDFSLSGSSIHLMLPKPFSTEALQNALVGLLQGH